MLALISDIHSNLEALDAVLGDMSAFDVTDVYCLGDVIGYGPNPREVLDRVRRCRFVLLGNHEDGLLFSARDFNDRARRALEWTKNELLSSRFPKEDNYAFWDFIDTFEKERHEDGRLFVHGTPRSPTNEYLMPGDALDRGKMTDVFASQDCRVGFGGHTHVPGVFAEGGTFQHQASLPEVVRLPKAKAFVNIGSVGQPRDCDNRASYVLVDGDEIRFRRVTYDIARTMQKIRAIPELDDFLAARLKSGQ